MKKEQQNSGDSVDLWTNEKIKSSFIRKNVLLISDLISIQLWQ